MYALHEFVKPLSNNSVKKKLNTPLLTVTYCRKTVETVLLQKCHCCETVILLYFAISTAYVVLEWAKTSKPHLTKPRVGLFQSYAMNHHMYFEVQFDE